MPFGAHIFALLETALAECFQYHSGLDTFLQRCGIEAPRVGAARQRAEERNKVSGRFSKAPKRVVAQELLRDLSSGTLADDRLVAALITALCKGSFPGASQSGLVGISQHMVKFHVESLFRKLGAVTRADAVRKGLRQRLFEI
ncbi:MAG TPA: helix-turn-helix transcriptional regulator [Burkholderiaceae bacterium]|nr:helix-turn-helix transcriptional regulator [Burkholderiaceae bacterium]